MKMTGGSWQFKPLSRAPAAALVAQTVKNPPAMQETQVQSMGWEDSLEKRMATHSSIGEAFYCSAVFPGSVALGQGLENYP